MLAWKTEALKEVLLTISSLCVLFRHHVEWAGRAINNVNPQTFHPRGDRWSWCWKNQQPPASREGLPLMYGLAPTSVYSKVLHTFIYRSASPWYSVCRYFLCRICLFNRCILAHWQEHQLSPGLHDPLWCREDTRSLCHVLGTWLQVDTVLWSKERNGPEVQLQRQGLWGRVWLLSWWGSVRGLGKTRQVWHCFVLFFFQIWEKVDQLWWIDGLCSSRETSVSVSCEMHFQPVVFL